MQKWKQEALEHIHNYAENPEHSSIRLSSYINGYIEACRTREAEFLDFIVEARTIIMDADHKDYPRAWLEKSRAILGEG